MSSTLNFEVNTEPMGESILVVAGGVASTVQAVERSAVRLAQAEDQAAQYVSTKITTGFHTLIQSQLNQKKAAAFAKVQAFNAQLVAEKATASYLEAQFGEDFQRIKGRYNKLFESLNKTLRSRIAELDKPIFQIIDRDYRQGIARRTFSVALPVVAGQESAEAGRKLEIGKTKGQITRLLSAVQNYLIKIKYLQLQVGSILLQQPAKIVTKLKLSAVVVEAQMSVAGQTLKTLHLPAAPEGVDFPRQLHRHLLDRESWQADWFDPDPGFKESVETAFRVQLDRSGLSAREKELALALFQKSSWKVNFGGGT